MRRRKNVKKKHEKPPPEGPEVKTITDQLNAALKDASLQSVEVLSGRYHRRGDPVGLSSLKGKLPLPIESVCCKGKFIYFVLTDVKPEKKQRWTFIWNTLGMSGLWSKTKDEHSRIKFSTSVGDFYFEDVRNFGTMHFDRTYLQTEKKLSSLGLDLLATDHSLQEFKARLKKRSSKTIVEVLMDQTVTSGVGNYIKCEALYDSEISPHRHTNSLRDDELERLLASLKDTMRASYRAKGHTMSDYRDLTGEEGTYKFALAVYNRSKDPEGRQVVREQTMDGRTTHWVPEVQK